MENVKSLVKAARDCLYVLKWAVQSRLLVLFLQLVFHNVIPDHTPSMDDVTMKDHRGPPHDVITERLLGGFDSWDSEYYIFIAEKGYTFEQTMAFFPLYPLLMRCLSYTVFYPLTLVTSLRSVLLVSGVTINFAIFPLAAVALYLLTLEFTHNRRLSFLAAILFCLNPAGVFMSTVYTETLFAFFSFSGMLLVQKKRTWLATLCFSLASATRSNGIVLIGFIGYGCLVTILTHSRSSKAAEDRPVANAVRNLLTASAQCVVILTPFVLFQAYGYLLYCSEGVREDSLLGNVPDPLPLRPPPPPPWCDWSLPLPYSYIQQRYWDVGFGRYFQWRQLPNFLLAVPTVLVCVLSVRQYCTAGREHILITGVVLRPYVVHLLVLLVFGIFNMHIQVLTRFILSSSPVVYCLTAEATLTVLVQLKVARLVDPSLYSGRVIVLSVARALFKMDVSHVSRAPLFWSRLVACYCAGYLLLGCALHCNFYPWT